MIDAHWLEPPSSVMYTYCRRLEGLIHTIPAIGGVGGVSETMGIELPVGGASGWVISVQAAF